MEVKASANKLTITFNRNMSTESIIEFIGERISANVFGANIESGRQVLPEVRKLSDTETLYITAAITEFCKNNLPIVKFISNQGESSLMVRASSDNLTVTFNVDKANESVVRFGGERYFGNVFGAYGETGEQVFPEKRKLSKSETLYIIEAVSEYSKTEIPKVEFVWLHNEI